jgi:hypothetical protein
MSSNTSDTHWLNLLKGGHDDAARQLWQRYFRLLVSSARQHLGVPPKRGADEEDVALSAFDSFCRGVEQGRFPRMDNRNDRRTVLLHLVARKASRLIEHEGCAKRGGQVHIEADEALAELIDSETTPQLAAQIADECRRLLDKLGADDLRQIALWLMEGYAVDEVSVKLGRSPRTVARKLDLIRQMWREEGHA